MTTSNKSIAREILSEGAFNGIFPGWGQSRIAALSYDSPDKVKVIADTSSPTLKGNDEEFNVPRKVAKLTPLWSVSIAGCDLMGSALYTVGTVSAYSGKLAPVGLFLVTSMLFLFRRVYSEVVTAIPVNGGTYNLMLNTTTKKTAGFVACLSILSYTATAILSAFDAVVYMSEIWTTVDVRLFSCLILLFFGAVTICGVKDSAQVTLCMFLVHMFTLTLLIVWGFAYGCQDNFSLFSENLRTPVPSIYDSNSKLLAEHNPGAAIYYGYSSGLLGITGFETASNYVEDMANTAVFVTTVNWMWFMVGIYNPVISLVAMMVLPMDTIYNHPSDVLAVMADELGGYGFKVFLCADAILILCGGVLTALVGISGLLSRLAKDRVLPESFGYTNSRGAFYVAIIAFVTLAITLFLAIYDPSNPTAINNFGGVFAIAFLTVLTAFGCGAILLKLYRPRIARLVIAKWWQIIISISCVFIGLIGNIILTPTVFYLFLAYLAGIVAVVTYMFLRVEILSFGIWMIRKIWLSIEKQQLEIEKNSHIISACTEQFNYDEEKQIETVLINRKQLRAAVRKSILVVNPSHLNPEQREQSQGTSENGLSSTTSPAKNSIIRTLSAKGDSFFHVKKRTGSADAAAEPKLNSPNGTTPSSTHPERSGSALDLIQYVQQRFSSLQLYVPMRFYDRYSSQSFDEIEMVLQKPIIGKYLRFLMNELDSLVSVPFVYLAKNSDPISLQLAVSYIDSNELSNNIYILHFVDDRKAIGAYHEYQAELEQHRQKLDSPALAVPDHGFLLNLFMKDASSIGKGEDFAAATSSSFSVKNQLNFEASLPTLPHETQQLLHNVAVLDAFYTYKKIHAIVIRGGFFSPSCLDCVANYLKLRKNHMIMGVPDQKFPFPFAKLGGCRIAVPDADSSVRQNASAHLRNVLQTIHKQSDVAESLHTQPPMETGLESVISLQDQQQQQQQQKESSDNLDI